MISIHSDRFRIYSIILIGRRWMKRYIFKKKHFRIKINSINGKCFFTIRSCEHIGFSSFFEVSFSRKNPVRFISPFTFVSCHLTFTLSHLSSRLQLSRVEQWHWITQRSIISRIRNAKRLLTGHLLHASRHRSIKNSIRAIERRNIIDTVTR